MTVPASSESWQPPPLFALPLAGGSVLTLSRDLADPRGMVVAIANAPVVVAVRIPREHVQHLVQALDDFLYDSRP